ncbi:MAG: AAA family ATPase, partial [Actinomycetota bacterium]
MTQPDLPTSDAVLRPHAEAEYAGELMALADADDRPRPPGWRLSPWAVVEYLLGGTVSTAAGDIVVRPKYVGQRRLIEIAVATLATDRALLLLGVPGTAKTWVSEHLAAAISGDSTLLVQGTAGTTEETLRYGWNYAQLLAEGPSEAALVPSPIHRAMRRGSIVRVEELTRMPPEVQDALVTVLSEKVLPVPELDTEVAAIPGFNLVATANDRDRGVNDMSSALRRRFNTVVLPLPTSIE